MKRILRPIGITAFWITWPAIWVSVRFTQRARVVVVAAEQVLLVNNWYGDGTWSFPGGGVQKSEESAMAATRELHEEVGVDLGVDQLHLLYRKPYKYHGFSYKCHYYRAELQEPLRVRPHFPEVLDARWVPIHDLHHYKLSPDVIPALMARNALLQ